MEHAQPEYIYHHTAQRFPNDPKFAAVGINSGQWYLPHVWAPTAWATTVGSTAMRVCVVSQASLGSLLGPACTFAFAVEEEAGSCCAALRCCMAGMLPCASRSCMAGQLATVHRWAARQRCSARPLRLLHCRVHARHMHEGT